jgi:hypothetical protein
MRCGELLAISRARDTRLHALCQLAQAAADAPVVSGRRRGCRHPALEARALVCCACCRAPELSLQELHCMRALLNCVLALAAGLSYAGWCPC